MIEFKMTGVEELMRVLKELGDEKVARRVRESAIRAGSKVVLKEAKYNAPYRKTPRDGDGVKLRDSLAIRVKSYSNNGVTVGVVGPRSGVAPYAHLVEYGTKMRYWKTVGGENMYRYVPSLDAVITVSAHPTGVMPAYQFLGRAVRGKKFGAFDAMMKKAAQRIKKIAGSK